MFQAIRQFLFSPAMPFWRYCLIAYPVVLIPSLAIAVLARQTFQMAGADLDRVSAPDRTASLGEFLGVVVFAPLAETVLLALTVVVLTAFTRRPVWVAVASGVVWGCFHGAVGALWFFGTVWSFFVFTCAYLHWRKESFGKGFLSAAIPHAMLNLTVMGVVALAGKTS